MKFVVTFILVVFSMGTAWSAPHPLTGSSIINRPDNSLAFTQMGFKVAGIPDYWLYHKKIESSQPTIEIGTPKKMLLSFRSERVSSKTQLETYVRQYLKDYNQYGLEVAGLQSNPGKVTVDLNQKNKLSKSRQMFFHKDSRMIIATCTDITESFDNTIKVCNQILSTFQWR